MTLLRQRPDGSWPPSGFASVCTLRHMSARAHATCATCTHAHVSGVCGHARCGVPFARKGTLPFTLACQSSHAALAPKGASKPCSTDHLAKSDAPRVPKKLRT